MGAPVPVVDGALFDGRLGEAADGLWPSVRPSPHVLPTVTQAVTAPAGRDRTIHRAHIGASVAHLSGTRVCRGIRLRWRIHHGRRRRVIGRRRIIIWARIVSRAVEARPVKRDPDPDEYSGVGRAY